MNFARTNHPSSPIKRLGATPVSPHETHFRVWAPRRISVAVEIGRRGATTRHNLARQESGYFAGTAPDAGPGTLYQYVLDDHVTRPDPASAYQPHGVHGASQVVDPHSFAWTNQAWEGVPKRELIIYELHVGTFTADGTFRAAIERLAELVELGITAVEIMPVAQSPGRWNWGYDGVDLFAVSNSYGEPDDFKACIDACHGLGLAVVLDVVYNHLGPEGNYLADFGPYFSHKHHTPWGDALNFDDRHSAHVRQFMVDNAIYWLDEFHLDGLRLDAVHLMLDDSQPTILDEIRAAVTNFAATTERAIHLIAEANVYDRDLLDFDQDRPTYDAIWCDCLMHSIYAHALPDLQIAHREYRGASDLADVLRHGYVYEFTDRQPVRVARQPHGQPFAGENKRPHIASFVTGLQTHDGVGNHPHGKRLHQLTSQAFQKAAAAITLLFPSIPLIFMGEENATEAPFPFFVDFEDPALRKAVDRGRAREYPQHAWVGALAPSDPAAFQIANCHDASRGDADVLAWYRELIALRKQGVAAGWLATDRLSSEHDAALDIFSLRFTGDDGQVIVVLIRLTPVARNDVEPVRISLDGELLLSSEPIVRADDGDVLLQPNHAVVTRRCC